jgi:undecaprenyl-diphosphatase
MSLPTSDRGRVAPTTVHAIALGALQGPAELLPISSSAHLGLLPWFLGWEDEHQDAELEKAFEVALHAGTAAALLITLRSEVADAMHGMRIGRLSLIGLSFTPAALVGYALERPIERHLGTPATIAGGLVAGSVAMALADRRPQLRSHEDADWRDALALGLGQACALIPGVSRNGATLAAARMQRFTRRDANRLSRHVALPVIAGASLLKGSRLRRRGLPAESVAPFAVGALTSFVSTLASTWLIRQVERDRSPLPYAAYRIALAGVVLAEMRKHP